MLGNLLPAQVVLLERDTFGSGEGVWAAAFVFGDALLVYEGDDLRCAGRLRDAEPLEPGARITDERPTVAAGVAVAEGRVWVFGIPRTERERRMVDEFDAASCAYLRSHELPVTARAFAYHDGIFYVQHEEPYPQILALRLRAP